MDEPIDPDRDKVVLDIIPECLKREMPIFGICRGIQEINVACGGTLFIECITKMVKMTTVCHKMTMPL